MLSFASSHHCGAHWCYEPPRQDRTAKRQPSCERCRSGSHVGEDSQAKFKPYAGGAHKSFSNWPNASATPPIHKKPNVLAMNWAEWFLAADAQDRALGQSAAERASALD